MTRFILKRIFESLPVLLVIITATFFMIRLAPGGPFDSEKTVLPEIKRALEDAYHLNDPLLVQYKDYLLMLARGDLGPSFKYQARTVNELLWEGLPTTFELGVYALMLALALGLLSGLIAALRKNTWLDYFPMSVAMTGICVPSFLLGPLMALVFGIWLGWLPVSGWTSAESKILPSITLGAAYAAYVSRLVRGEMLEILAQDFIRTARAKGLSEALVLMRHGLRGALIPVASFLGPAIAGLLSGSFVVESVFQIPGLGRFYVQSAFNRDYTVIMGTTIMFSVLILVCNLLSDVLAAWLNPRLRMERT